jgi:hypothetical protein
MIRQTVCAARSFYGETELEQSGAAERGKLREKLVDLAPKQVLAEFLGDAGSVFDLQSVAHGQTPVLKEWRKVLTCKFVQACGDMFWVLKDIPNRNIGKNEMEIWGSLWRIMSERRDADGRAIWLRWEHFKVVSTPVKPM